MPGVFDQKSFNAEVFGYAVGNIESTKKSELIRSRAIRQRPDLAAAMREQNGGNIMTSALTGSISGTEAQNYDGQTNIESNKVGTFNHTRVVVGRTSSWTEKDFTFDITGGKDVLQEIAAQVAEYIDELDQDTLVAILEGVFNMTGAKNKEFVDTHTHDITKVTNSEGKTGYMDATSMNTAMQKACGDKKRKFSLAIMHSSVSTNLENLKILVYAKFNDDRGLERDVAIGTVNGRLVLIDDGMPAEETEVEAAVAGVYSVEIKTALAAGDKVEIAGVEYEYSADATTAVQQATAIEALLKADEEVSAIYDVTRKSGALIFTEKEGKEGSGAPEVNDADLSAGAVEQETTTEGVAAKVAVTYTTYVLGEGAIEFTDCGAKVPYEAVRDARLNGGEDSLIVRQRKCWSPFGISFTNKQMATASPTDAELRNGINWSLDSTADENHKEYIEPKTIPIARIISLG